MFIVLYTDEGPESALPTDQPESQRMSLAVHLAGVHAQRGRKAQHIFVFMHHPRWLEGVR